MYSLIDEAIKIKYMNLTDQHKLESLKALSKEIGEFLYEEVKDLNDWSKVYEKIMNFFFGGWSTPPELSELSEQELKKYKEMVDPETGRPYNIPMLFPQDPFYTQKYIYFMWLKENRPSCFKRIMNWD